MCKREIQAESFMNLALSGRKSGCILILACAFLSSWVGAQTCQTAADLEEATKSAVTAAGQRYFDLASKGDVASLRQNAIPSLASSFAGIEATVKDHQPDLAGGQATVKAAFVLESPNPPAADGEFYCGVFGKNGQTANSAVFYLNNLPSGKYAVILLDANSAKGRTMFTEILQQMGSDWKLGGLYIKASQAAGHDSDWYLARAREYKAKGQLHNAWFYFVEGRNLVSPLNFMSTLATDKLYDESQTAQQTDLPTGGNTVELAAGTTKYTIVSMFPEVVGNDLDLIVKYQVADASNSNEAYQSNVAVIKAVVTKYPELRDAFAGIVGRAVDPSGRDYGTLLAMKDIK
jgi:hypothetical protein